MGQYITKEEKEKIFEEYGGNKNNSGSTEAQVALFTQKIAGLSEHLILNKKDHACRRTLLTLVGKRKRHLQYLMQKDIVKYRALIEKLGIRK